MLESKKGAGMKKTLLFGISITLAFATSGYEDLESLLQSKSSLSINGKFYQYDFNDDGSIAPNDWIYISSNGRKYRLLGATPTNSNPFGWKSINITPQGKPLFYFIHYGKGPFEWIVISSDGKKVFKLDGVTDQHTFKYSPQLDIQFDIGGNKIQVKIPNESENTNPSIPIPPQPKSNQNGLLSLPPQPSL